MALKIRLRQQGRKNRTIYRLVLSDVRSPRDGKFIETLGWYNPLESEPEKSIFVHAERVLHWLGHGAILTEKAELLVKKIAPHVIENYLKKRTEARAKVCKKRRELRKKGEKAVAV